MNSRKETQTSFDHQGNLHMVRPRPAPIEAIRLEEPRLRRVCDELISEHNAHTVLLYGSRVDGSFGVDSDYDIAAFGPIGELFRIARLEDGFYLDVWVYPEADLARDPTLEHLRLRGSKILLQRDDEVTTFLDKIEERFRHGAPRLTANEVAAREVWMQKMLGRLARGDPEGNYRRIELLQALLEHYFQVRGLWFQGAKKSLRWLEQFDPQTYRAYSLALQPNASSEAISSVVGLMADRKEER
jgi:predicted nucleotidyltransferase